MGVPGFYRWSVRRVPNVRHKGSKPPYEFDNLYLDFNGVVHGAIDEWGGLQDEDVLFSLIEAQISMLVSLARPTVLLYIALDGVAPRAKMNQQRSRRFRAAQDKAAAANTLEGVDNNFDRNAVTPGTAFMLRLSKRLQVWADGAAQHPELLGVTVVISDDRDPGEGEHKIMEVIRHHPDNTHCLVSSDADLVFLGLVSPAEHVYLLRANQNRRRAPGGHPLAHNMVDAQAEGAQEPSAPIEMTATDDYELLSITAVRKFLAQQFPGCDERRVAADFVAMCCLAGNDFLPHIQAVDIYQGGIDRLLAAYKAINPAESGFLVSENLSLELPRWKALLGQFAEVEAETMLEVVGLGLGQKMPPFKGPGPPNESWDGLSVLVMWAPPRASAADIVAAMSKQDCVASIALGVRTKNGPRGPTSWLVRFADAKSAVKTLVSVRSIWGTKLTVNWVDPKTCDLVEPVEGPFETTTWQADLDAMIRDSFEFWLGPKNLKNDAFLRRHVRANSDRFVPIRVFILRSSPFLEVKGEGDEVMVRGVEDHSFRPEEGQEQVARQHEALTCVAVGDCIGAVQALRHAYYAKHSGPAANGSPSADDLVGMEQDRSRAFLAGIEWVVRYYIRGCSSWSWFYPAHYPPLCTSLLMHSDQPLDTPSLDSPFPPELQLLAVLPPQSAELLPEPLRFLLLDPASPVLEFYPQEFEVDLKEGDREWQGIPLLPFVNETKLRAALSDLNVSDSCHHFEPAHAFRMREPKGNGMRSLGAWLVKCCSVREDVIHVWDFQVRAPLAPGRTYNGSGLPCTRPEEVQIVEVSAAAQSSDRRGKGGSKGGRKGRGKGGRRRT